VKEIVREKLLLDGQVAEWLKRFGEGDEGEVGR
jgi:hypothetical protein